MSEVDTVASEVNTTEFSDLHVVGPSDDVANSQSEAEDNSRVRLVEPILFDTSKAGKREVDPADLVGKVFVNAYHISAKPDDGDTGLPGSYGFTFADGSRYHVRIHGRQEADIDVDIDEDDLAGKHVTAASFLRCEGHFFYNYRFIGLRNRGMMDYIALGIKVEGSEEWVKFIGTEMEYNSDGDGLVKSEYHDVFLVKMKGAAVQKTGSRKH